MPESNLNGGFEKAHPLRYRVGLLLSGAILGSLLPANANAHAPETLEPMNSVAQQQTELRHNYKDQVRKDNQQEWKLEWSSGFNDDVVPSRWLIQQATPDMPHLEQFRSDNVKVSNGLLEIISNRDCVGPGVELRYHPEVCPEGTVPKYYSGRIETLPHLTDDFKVVFKARISDMAVRGVRNALWLKNKQPYCITGSETDTGEFDVLEWYSNKASYTTATSHIYCRDGDFDTSYHREKYDKSWAEEWHEWSVEFKNNTVTYLGDEEPIKIIGSDEYVDDHRTFESVSRTQYKEVINQPWSIIMNTYVFPEAEDPSVAFTPPDPEKPFPTAKFSVDYVKVYSLK